MMRERFARLLRAANSGVLDVDEARVEDVAANVSDTTVPCRRPGIPLLVPAAIALWAIAALTYSAHIASRDVVEHLPSVVMVAAIALAAAIACFVKGRDKAAAVIVFAALGVIVGCVGSDQMIASMESSSHGSQIRTFTLEEDSSRSENGSSCEASTVDEAGKRVRVLLYLSTDDQRYRGQVLEGECALTDISNDMIDRYWLQGVSKKASLKEFGVGEPPFPMDVLIDVRKRAIDLFAQHCGGSTGILQALVCGFRPTIRDDGTYDEFKTCGIAHIVAVSGAHLAIVAMLLLALLKLMRLPRMMTVAIEVAFLLMYLVFAGIPISAVRAVVMVVLSMTSFLARRRAFSLNSLAVCMLVFIIASPGVSVSISFFLSAGSVLGISVFAPLFKGLLTTQSETVSAVVTDPLSLTLASNVMTLPASAALFSQLSLIAPMANIVVAPLFSLACIAGLACVLIGLLIAPLAGAFMGLAALCVMPLACSVDIMSKMPYACIAVAPPFELMAALSCALAAALWLGWYRLRGRLLKSAVPLLAIICAILVIIPADHGNRISMLDVGQGDSFLIESAGSAVLVDTGNKDTLLREAIAQREIRHLDGVIITHPDSDHCESLASLLGYVNVDRIFVARDLLDCGCGHCAELVDAVGRAGPGKVTGLDVGDSLRVGNFTLEVIWPYAFQDGGGNGDSLTLLATCDADADGIPDMRALFCGDAESEQLKEMARLGTLRDLDILKVGHHGSRAALTDELVDVMTPRIALIGVGAKNRYGHPNEETLEHLERSDAVVYRSDLHGSVDVSVFADEMRIVCEKACDDIPQRATVGYE